MRCIDEVYDEEEEDDDQPLYFPYPLKVAVPIMAAQHLLFFGVIEAVLTSLVVIYFQRSDPSMLGR